MKACTICGERKPSDKNHFRIEKKAGTASKAGVKNVLENKTKYIIKK